MTTSPRTTNNRKNRTATKQRVLTGVAALGALGLALSWTHWPATRAALPAPQKPLLTVTAMPLETVSAFDRERRFVGQVEAARLSELGFQLAGELATVRVREGDAVSAGQPLATLDTARLDSRMGELVASRNAAEADLRLAISTSKRVRGLAAKGHASGQELDEAEERQAAARARLNLARAQIESLETERAKMQLHAPYDAVVIARSADEGQVLPTGAPVLTLQEQRAPTVRIAVPVKFTAGLRVGETRSVEISGEAYAGRLRAILPVTERQARTVDVLLDLDATLGQVPAGALAELALAETVSAEGAWVQSSALTAGTRGTWTLYTVTASEDTQSQPIAQPEAVYEVGALVVELLAEEDDRVFVRGYFPPSIQVVSEGLNRIVPGQQVTLAPTLLGAR